MKVKIKCSWCGNEFECEPLYRSSKTNDVIRNQIRCPCCLRFLPSSIKIPTGNVVGSSHLHKEYV